MINIDYHLTNIYHRLLGKLQAQYIRKAISLIRVRLSNATRNVFTLLSSCVTVNPISHFQLGYLC